MQSWIFSIITRVLLTPHFWTVMHITLLYIILLCVLKYHQVCFELRWSHLLLWESLVNTALHLPGPFLWNPYYSPAGKEKNTNYHFVGKCMTDKIKMQSQWCCTFTIWSPVRSPSIAAGLSSWMPAMKMPTSFPPARRRPTLSPFWKLIISVLGLWEIIR